MLLCRAIWLYQTKDNGQKLKKIAKMLKKFNTALKNEKKSANKNCEVP